MMLQPVMNHMALVSKRMGKIQTLFFNFLSGYIYKIQELFVVAEVRSHFQRPILPI